MEKEFFSKDRHIIIRKGFVFTFTKVSSVSWLIEVSISLCGDYSVSTFSIVRVTEAVLLYNKLK